MRRGMVYACSQIAHVREAVRSAISCKAHMPHLTRQIFVSRPVHQAATGMLAAHFDDVVVVDQLTYPHRPRFDAVLTADFDQAIFIDSDTLFLSSVEDVFDALEYFDIGAVLGPQSTYKQAIERGIYDILPKLPEAVREWNTGFLAARIDAPFRALARDWSELFGKCLQRGLEWDQPSLRSALAASRLRVVALPENYNFRVVIPRFINGPVKVLHGHADLDKIAGYINAHPGMRLYQPKREELRPAR